MEVTDLWRYPVKSTAGLQVGSVAVDHLGLVADRRWGLRDRGTGLVLTARRAPELLLATPVLAEDDGTVALRLPDGTTTAEPAVLSRWLGRDVELVRAGAGTVGSYEIAVDEAGESATAPDALTDGWDGAWQRWDGPAGVFHDSTRTRVSIIGSASLGDWSVRRFRPNVVVTGDERALLGERVRIGTVVLQVVKEIDRCVVVTRAQEGLDRDAEVLRRIHAERGGDLGVGAVVVDAGGMAVGDRVVVG